MSFDPSPRQLVERGLTDALARTRQVCGDDEATLLNVLVPLTEALGWAYALDQWHARRVDPTNHRLWKNARVNDPDGAVVAGFLNARHQVGHELTVVARVLVDRYSDTFHNTVGAPSKALTDQATSPECWRWMRQSDTSHDGAAEYEAHLQGKPLVEPFEAIERFYLSKASHLP